MSTSLIIFSLIVLGLVVFIIAYVCFHAQKKEKWVKEDLEQREWLHDNSK